jgi:hypothetical protein
VCRSPWLKGSGLKGEENSKIRSDSGDRLECFNLMTELDIATVDEAVALPLQIVLTALLPERIRRRSQQSAFQ